MERQSHGFDYQTDIIIKESLNADPFYTGKWDAYNATFSLPVSVKCIGYKNSIDFGDFIRQTQVDTDFILYLGLWKDKKDNIIQEYKIIIKKDIWLSYFGDTSITKIMIEEMKGISNDRSDDSKWKEFRNKYKKLYGDSIVSLRFKRDHKKQKRIQCGINMTNFVNLVVGQSISI
jgi:hypothetical protein